MNFIYDLRRLQNKQQLIDFLSVTKKSFDYIVGFDPNSDLSNQSFFTEYDCRNFNTTLR